MGQHCDDVGSKVSGVFLLTGDSDSIGGSTVRSEDTLQCILHSKYNALKLIKSHAKATDCKVQIRELEE
jgi:hypothetical protein